VLVEWFVDSNFALEDTKFDSSWKKKKLRIGESGFWLRLISCLTLVDLWTGCATKSPDDWLM